MASLRFRELENESKRLRKELLPNAFDPLGNYAPRVQTLTRAYLLLTHAAIESYLEQEAKRLARMSETAWQNKGKVTRPLASLLTHQEKLPAPQSSGSSTPEQLLQSGIREAFQSYYKSVKDNHGIKEKNIMALFGPIGVETSRFPSTMLPTLNSFGESRGQHAHQGGRLAQQLDPQTEYYNILSILTLLEVFDNNLKSFEKLSR